MGIEDEIGGVGHVYPGQYHTPRIVTVPMNWIEMQRRVRERAEQKLAYRKTLRVQIEDRVYRLRGRIADWIAPEGWNDE